MTICCEIWLSLCGVYSKQMLIHCVVLGLILGTGLCMCSLISAFLLNYKPDISFSGCGPDAIQPVSLLVLAGCKIC